MTKKNIDKKIQEQIDKVDIVQTQETDGVETLLHPGLKKQFVASLENLLVLYNDFISPKDATIKTALEFLPMLSVYGTWLAAQLGVTQDEYNAIVDLYLLKFDLIEE